MVVGRSYRLTYWLHISAYTKGTLSIGTCNDAFAIQDSNTYTATNGSGDVYTLDFVYDSDCDKLIIDAATSTVFTASIDNVSLREIGFTERNHRGTLLWPHTGAQLATFNEAGAMRLSDANFDNRDNKPAWMGYISKELFNTANTTTKSVTLEGWFVKDQHQKWASTPTDWIDARFDNVVSGAENSGKMKIKIAATGSSGGWGDIASDGYKFYLTAIFDDGTETLPDFQDTQGKVFYDNSDYVLTGSSGEKITVDVGVDAIDSNGMYAFDERMKAIRIYYSKVSDDNRELYELGTIDFKYGFQRGDGLGVHPWTSLGSDANGYAATINTVTFTDEFVGNTYELNTAYTADDTIMPEVKWKTATIVKNVTFIGNLEYDDGLEPKDIQGK